MLENYEEMRGTLSNMVNKSPNLKIAEKPKPKNILEMLTNPKQTIEIASNVNGIQQENQTKLKNKREKVKNPFRSKDYIHERLSDYNCEVLRIINLKKMSIMNCYLRFMRLVHIGNGLDIHWRTIVNLDMEITFDQFYEMIEYKTSEVLVFTIDCLCILHDVGCFVFVV